MNFFRSLNRKKRREFDKLDKGEKADIVAQEINEKVESATNTAIAKAFVNGTIFANNLLYEKYVVNWDAAKYKEKRDVAAALIEEIRMHYNKSHPADEEEDKEEE